LIFNKRRITIPEYLSLYDGNADASLPNIRALRTDAAGFVGISARLVGDDSRNDPWRQFQAYFGGIIGAGYLAYAIRAVLEYGGRCCPVVCVASKDEFLGARMANTILSSAGQPGRKIEALSPGVWGN
jgi:uncharacterized protein